MVLLLVFMQLTRDLFAIAKFLLGKIVVLLYIFYIIIYWWIKILNVMIIALKGDLQFSSLWMYFRASNFTERVCSGKPNYYKIARNNVKQEHCSTQLICVTKIRYW